MFSTRFTTSTGVEIGDEYVRVFSLSSPVALSCTRIALTSNALAARLENTAAALATALSGITGSHRLTTAVSLPTATVTTLPLPPVSDIPYYLASLESLRGMHWDWTPLALPSHILLITCPAPKIHFVRDVGILTGKKWRAIDVDILALYRALREHMSSEIAAGLYFMQNTCVCFVFSRTQVFSVHVPLHYSHKQADHQALLDYLQQCLKEFSPYTIGEVILVGDITTQSDVNHTIEESIGIPVVYANPLHFMSDNIKLSHSIDPIEGPRWALAYGLALRGKYEKY